MTTNRTPRPGQAYSSPEGRPLLYVRTEARPGSKVPEHYFVGVDVERRNVGHCWFAELPEDMILVLDPGASQAATELEGQLAHAHRQVKALAAAMKEATTLVPVVTANHLRQVYSATMAEEDS